jgi:hypothetical protein
LRPPPSTSTGFHRIVEPAPQPADRPTPVLDGCNWSRLWVWWFAAGMRADELAACRGWLEEFAGRCSRRRRVLVVMELLVPVKL